MSKTPTKHPGFTNVARGIARKEGVPLESAKAILASAAHHASPAAHKANPALNKVGGSHKK